MFEKKIRLFNLLGFEVKLDASWIILAVLISWTLATGYFPYHYPYLHPNQYWTMGIIGALGLFISIVLHELSHAIIARRFGIPMRGITLFIFGGVAEMDDEPKSAKSELYMAIAGPIASIIIGYIFHLILKYAAAPDWPLTTLGVISYLRWINWILAAFNLLPAFPLDGGRVLRSILWMWKKNLRWATRIASSIGSTFGFLLSIFGVMQFFAGSVLSGIWWLLIGIFLNKASQMSYQRVLLNQAFQGIPVSKFMQTNVVTVNPELLIGELVENYIYHHHFTFFPVVDNGRLMGYISTAAVKNIPREQWSNRHVKEVMHPYSPTNTISPDTDVMKAINLMSAGQNTKLLVAEQGKLAGILTLKDLFGFIAVKTDLEGDWEE